jgi:hypothetical protein
MTTDQRVTETRTKISVKEVENTRYECAVCEMVYDEEAVITVGLDRRNTTDDMFGGRAPEVERVVCTHCAEGLFDYTADAGWTPERKQILPPQLVERATVNAFVGLILSIPAACISAGLALQGVPVATAVGYGAVMLMIILALLGVRRLS